MKGIPAGQVSWVLTFQSPALPSGCHLNLSITLHFLLQLCEDPASIGGLSPSPPTARPLQPASCRPLSLSLFQNANVAPCGADPDASWGTRGTHNGDPCGSLARPESLAHVYQSHSETSLWELLAEGSAPWMKGLLGIPVDPSALPSCAAGACHGFLGAVNRLE